MQCKIQNPNERFVKNTISKKKKTREKNEDVGKEKKTE